MKEKLINKVFQNQILSVMPLKRVLMVSHVCLKSISGHKMHFKFLKLGLTVKIHISTKTCVTGKSMILHKALHTPLESVVLND